MSTWLPALDGVITKLESGARVADVGCGHGASTVLMAEAFPASRFFGFDFHSPSIDHAGERAAAAGVADRVTFTHAAATDYDETGFDLVCFFDCLHDMGDPVGPARHAHEALADDGTVLLVEPFAGDRLEDNCNPVGRMFYAAGTFICTRSRCPRTSAGPSAPRPGKPGCARCSPKQGSARSGAPRDSLQPDPRSPPIARRSAEQPPPETAAGTPPDTSSPVTRRFGLHDDASLPG